MAATNPFRVSDLIAKYGWKVMPYLSNLGPLLLAEAQVLFVDSGHTNASDADDTEHGHSFEKPLATIDYAIGLCTAAERSVILVAPGHNEPLAAATIDFDVSDITCIGIGEGSNRPTIDFDNTASQVIIGANNVHLINLRFMPSIDDIVIGVEIEASVTGTILEKCEWAEMEDTGDEFILGLDIKAGCTDTKVTNCLFRTELTADGATDGIKLTGASDNVIIENSRFIGNWSNAAITNDTGAATDLLIDHCTIKVQDTNAVGITALTTTTGIIRDTIIEATSVTVDSMIVAPDMAWFNNYGVTTDGTAAELIGGGEVNAQIVAHGLDHLIGTACADTEDAVDMSTEITDHTILANILDDGGDSANYDRRYHSLVALGTDTDTIIEDITAAVPAAPTAGSLQDIMNVGENTYSKATDSLEAIANKIIPSGANDVWFVDSDMGADTGDGKSWATAKQLITSGVALLTDGDTLYVRGTTAFAEAVTSPDGVDNVKIIGVSGSKRGPQWASDATGTPALTIDGEKNWEIYNIRFQAYAASTVACLRVNDGRGLVVDNCYFHGGGNAHSAICLSGSCPQSRIENSFFHEFYTIAHGDSGNNYEATIWGQNYTQSAVGVDLINNHFCANLDDVKLQAHSCRIMGNTFTKTNPLSSTTTTLNLVCSGSSVGGNVVSGNTFGNIINDITTGNGYYFSTTDDVAGNFCEDGLTGFAVAPRALVGTGQHSPFSRINHAFGTVYYVDEVTGSDSYDGLSPDQAFLTIAAAITASNLTVGSYNQNAIYVNASTYTEDLDTWPKNCDVIGVGSKVRITGHHTGTGFNVHWHNIEFRPGSESAAVVQATGASHGLEFHHCRFKNTGSTATIGLEIETGADQVIDDCWFGGNNVIPIAIRLGEITLADTEIHYQNMRITNNYICATTVGIQIDVGHSATSDSYQNLIKDNHITSQDPNDSGTQLAIGIDETRTDGHCGFEIVSNTISAVDAIHFGLVDAYSQFTCVNNHVVQGVTGAIEDSGS